MSLVKVAGTSTPTVLLLAARIGAGSYRDFQQHLLDEITNQMNSPATRASHAEAGRSTDDVLGASVTQRVALIESLLAGVPPREIALAVRKLSSAHTRVVVSGGYFSRHIAQIFALQLDEIIPNVDYAADPLGRDISKYLGLHKDSVVVIFDLRRYEAAAKELAAMAREQGATVIVITDEELSPTARAADIVLPVAVGVPRRAHSLVGQRLPSPAISGRPSPGRMMQPPGRNRADPIHKEEPPCDLDDAGFSSSRRPPSRWLVAVLWPCGC